MAQYNAHKARKIYIASCLSVCLNQKYCQAQVNTNYCTWKYFALNGSAVRPVTQRTWDCNRAGGKDRQQALSLQVEEMLLLHLKELLLDSNLLGCQLCDRETTQHLSVNAFPILHTACSGFCLQFDSGKEIFIHDKWMMINMTENAEDQ